MPEESNFRLVIQYDGRPFCGWQRQKNGPSVQESIEDACRRLCGSRVVVHGASRTDSGVHAAGQVASVQMSTGVPAHRIRKSLNSMLPQEIRILSVRKAPHDFHALRDAREKWYRYLILSSRSRSPFAPFFVSWLPYPLSVDRMRAAAAILMGKHDFRSFLAAGSSVKSTVRELRKLEIRRGGGVVSIVAVANGFLRHMVRIIAGTLIEVGRGKMEADDLLRILEGKDRRLAGPSAPAEGLTLLRVVY